MTAHAFDALAPDYDADFTGHPLGRRLREAVREHLATAFDSGQHVIDLGCGTGEDAVWLAGRGVDVTAVDASPSMLAQARAKAARASTPGQVRLVHLDMAALGGYLAGLPPETTFDGAYSDFGALNCVADRGAVAAALAARVATGGRVVLVVMGPACPWEVIAYLLRLRPRAAFRRLRQGGQAVLAEGAVVRVWYPTPRRLRREFEPWFRHVKTEGVGVLLPPTDFRGLVDRWPDVFDALGSLERRIAARFPATWLNDHFLMVLERC